MKKYILIAVIATTLFSCKENTSNQNTDTLEKHSEHATTNLTEAKEEIPAENLASTEIKIEGMTCQMGCANTIKTKLEALRGVASAEVSFDKANAIVAYDKTTLTEQDIKNTVNSIADGKLYKVVE